MTHFSLKSSIFLCATLVVLCGCRDETAIDDAILGESKSKYMEYLNKNCISCKISNFETFFVAIDKSGYANKQSKSLYYIKYSSDIITGWVYVFRFSNKYSYEKFYNKKIEENKISEWHDVNYKSGYLGGHCLSSNNNHDNIMIICDGYDSNEYYVGFGHP